MRTLVSGRSKWFFIFALLAWTGTLPAGEEPANTTSPSELGDPESVLQRALELERARSWSAAIDLYDKALEQWPSRTEFSHRRRLCETHYRLVRRYQDQSFRNILLKLSRERALGLFDELVERIETHYVDPVPLEPLVRKGLDNLEVALRDPNFLRTNSPQATPERVSWLRDALRRRRARLVIPDRGAAQLEVTAACDLARQAIGTNDAPIILEFTYGACDALDDYTSYLTPDKLDDLYAMIDGNFVGLGVELKQDVEGLRIVAVIRGGPAAEAGLKGGDLITHIAGAPVKGLSLDESANRLQGTEGSKVEVVVLHAGGNTDHYTLTRRHVEVESVTDVKIVDQAVGVGYVQLNGFQKSSTEELDKAITLLRKQGMKTLVLDLRGNPGGLLNVAVEMGERFIDNGVIVSTRGRAPGQSQTYRAVSKAVWKMPLYVLIDHDSASASEILAGALKDHHRAVVIGERSYGKGSVQSIFALRSVQAGLKLTTAKFYSPLSRPYSEQGVEPDVKISAAKADRHIVAKPVDGVPPETADTIGDPESDKVLGVAVKLAKAKLNAAR